MFNQPLLGHHLHGLEKREREGESKNFYVRERAILDDSLVEADITHCLTPLLDNYGINTSAKLPLKPLAVGLFEETQPIIRCQCHPLP